MARLFDGSDDAIDAPHSAVLDFTAAITVAIWARRTAGSGNPRIANRGYQKAWDLHTNTNGEVLWSLWDGSSSSFASGTTAIDDTWRHVVGTWDGTNQRVYFDGSEDASVAFSGPMATSSNGVAFGKLLGASDFFPGRLSHCALWNAGLSASEIASLANSISPLRIRRGALVAYWPLNGQSPEAEVVNGLAGTLVSAPSVVEEPPIPHSMVAA